MLKLWNESLVALLMPPIKVKMPDERSYEAKIITITGNLAKVRVDRQVSKLNQYSWTLFFVSLTTVANCLNGERPIIY